MIIGNGIDIVEVKRMKEVIRKWDNRFLNRVFTKKELAYSKEKKFFYRHLAARFACKESVLKAFGDAKLGIELKNIEVLNDKKGKPGIILHSDAKEFAKKMKIKKISISISHTDNFALASAIIWRR